MRQRWIERLSQGMNGALQDGGKRGLCTQYRLPSVQSGSRGPASVTQPHRNIRAGKCVLLRGDVQAGI